jgi:hypothetical protein
MKKKARRRTERERELKREKLIHTAKDKFSAVGPQIVI